MAVKCCSTYIFDRIFFILSCNKDSHEILDEFEIWQDPTMDCRVSCPWAFEKIPFDLQWERCCEPFSAFISNGIFFILAGNKDSLKISDEFEIQRVSTMDCRVTYPWVFEKSIFCVVATLAPSILILSSSYLEVTRIAITSRMSSNFSQIRPLTAELSALDSVKNQYLVLWPL